MMPRFIQYSVCSFFFFHFHFVNAQIGIGTVVPDPSAILELKSTNRGFLPPRMTDSQIQAIIQPQKGLTVYNLDSNTLTFFDGKKWVPVVRKESFIELFSGRFDDFDASNPKDNSIYFMTETQKMYLFSKPYLYEISLGSLSYVSELILHGNHTYKTFLSVSGKIWLDRNLGALSSDMSSADSYGDLYQWGRATDGHQIRSSDVVEGPITMGLEGDAFIAVPPSKSNSYSWSLDLTLDAWDSVEANNPCPAGFKVPSRSDFENELAYFNSIVENQTTPSSVISILPYAGRRRSTDGNVRLGNSCYWTNSMRSRFKGTVLYYDAVQQSFSIKTSLGAATGCAIRCVKQ